MTSKKTNEEKILALEQRMAQIRRQKQALQNKIKADERKVRAHRLIQIGAEVEKYCGEIADLEAFSDYIRANCEAVKGTQNHN